MNRKERFFFDEIGLYVDSEIKGKGRAEEKKLKKKGQKGKNETVLLVQSTDIFEASFE